MIHIMIAASALAAVAALSPAEPAAAVGTGPSAAPPAAAPAKPAKRTELTLTYLADAGQAAAVVLRCDPAGGAHPKPVQACSALRTAGGEPGQLKPARRMCTMIYAPVTAKIAGSWQGKPVKWSRQYGNSCELARATGVLFQF